MVGAGMVCACPLLVLFGGYELRGVDGVLPALLGGKWCGGVVQVLCMGGRGVCLVVSVCCLHGLACIRCRNDNKLSEIYKKLKITRLGTLCVTLCACCYGPCAGSATNWLPISRHPN